MSADAQAKPAATLDGTTRGLGLLLVGMAAFATWDQWAIWSTKDDYTFGYLVPFFSAYVLWDRWDELRALLTGGRADVAAPAGRVALVSAQVLAFLAVACFGLGAAARAVFGTGVGPTLAIAFGLAGAALTFGYLSVRGPQDAPATAVTRWRAVGLLVFPAGVWLISGPFLYLVDNQIKGALLTNVTEIVSGLLRASGHVIRVNGNTIVFPNGDAVGVAEACSGIRSLSACVFAGAFLGAVFLDGGFPGALLRRMALIALAGFTAILLNIGRNAFLTFHALEHGSRSLDRDLAGIEHGQPGFSALGSVHDLAGNVAMVGALALLVAFVPLLNRLGRTRLPSSEA
ncbi:MAG: exosortase/archaeosortase family protein [Verrucomicrobia bacterium]|nr:exosortase/archaeosortase family protein [Verrucomicrobiota bacterium]